MSSVAGLENSRFLQEKAFSFLGCKAFLGFKVLVYEEDPERTPKHRSPCPVALLSEWRHVRAQKSRLKYEIKFNLYQKLHS